MVEYFLLMKIRKGVKFLGFHLFFALRKGVPCVKIESGNLGNLWGQLKNHCYYHKAICDHSPKKLIAKKRSQCNAYVVCAT